ncbi:hypothetical protein NLU13_1512 [Sarocladium strictum]|uniref:Uncharacterized protein n=1 Tax=Sarocladium strictum TaxID=5046 RepID=A0AA39LCK6_SARSR|nr:hypothetical protein NLU13_1512 [Sarocladium strictum]
MKRCCRTHTAWLSPKPSSTLPRRWKSHDSASLTQEALLNKIEEGLGDAPDRPRVDPIKKSVQTVAGELPISPLFDPEWLAKRRRRTKVYNPKPSGRFRSKVHNNTYARALETPLRACPASRTLLPRFFLQDFEAVAHPKTGKPWWAPGPISFYHLDNDIDLAAMKKAEGLDKTAEDQMQENGRVEEPILNTDEPKTHTSEIGTTSTLQGAQETRDQPHESTDIQGSEEKAAPAQHTHHRGMGARAPVVSYLINKKSLLSQLKPGKVPLLAMRRGMSVDNTIRGSIWRPDMVNVLEGMLRNQATDALIRRANRGEGQNPHKFIEPCPGWENVKDVRLRGCVLWVPKNEVKGGGYPTLDVHAQFGAKLAVYNLPWLLGEAQVKRLREEAPMFRNNEILVLKQWPTWSVKSLHMLLWRIQGFLAEPQRRSSGSL